MIANKLTSIIVIDKNKELPVMVNDNFQPKGEDGSPTVVEFAPVGEISEQMADKLVKTYPKLYAKYDPAVHSASKEGYKIALNYRKPQFENIFNQLTPDQRDEVLAFMHDIANGVQRKTPVTVSDVVGTDETAKPSVEELRAKFFPQKDV